MILWRTYDNLGKNTGLLGKLYEYGDVHVMVLSCTFAKFYDYSSAQAELKEQSDHGLFCWPFHQHPLEAYTIRPICSLA